MSCSWLCRIGSMDLSSHAQCSGIHSVRLCVNGLGLKKGWTLVLNVPV
jgi:hypothetical protein